MIKSTGRLQTIHSGFCPRLDIVLVHGFAGHPTGTWTDEESGKCWPKDHVPDDMKPRTRVLTFSYDESPTRPYRRENLSNHSCDLLSRLDNSRRREGMLRPIVWVAHSAGGIIVKEVFFATPHHGGGSWPNVVLKIFNETPYFQVSGIPSHSRQLLPEADAHGLDRISREFASLSRNVAAFELVSFETRTPMVVGPDRYNLRVTVKPLTRDHFDICKLGEGSHDLAGVWSEIERIGSREPACREFDDSDLRALEGLGVDKMRSAEHYVLKPTEDTCRWIEERELFVNWLTKPGPQKLWINGKIGSGKTCLSRHIIKLLGSNENLAYCSLDNISISYKTTKSVLVWLMYEILSARKELIAMSLTSIYERERSSNGDAICNWSFNKVKQLWNSLKNALKSADGEDYRDTIVIDGVDQCLGGQDEDGLPHIKEFFRCINQDNAFRILVLSRRNSDLYDEQLRHRFYSYEMEEDDTRADISATIREAAGWIAKRYGYDSKTEWKIVKKIESKSEGMYLWANMVLEEIRKKELLKSELDDFLNNLPPSIIGLYDFILGRTGNSSTAESSSGSTGVNGFARHVLFWIAYQLHEMDEDEMRTAIYMLKTTGLPPRNPINPIADVETAANRAKTNLERDISRNCGALVTFTEHETFAPAHYTVRQFLVTPTEDLRRTYPQLRHHHKYYCGELQPDRIIRQLCTNYLLLPCFSSPENDKPCATPAAWVARVQLRVQKHPFSRYAARSWLIHRNMSPRETEMNGNAVYLQGSDQQRLLMPAAGASDDWRCSQSWKEIWRYYENPSLDFPTDDIPTDALRPRPGATSPQRLHVLFITSISSIAIAATTPFVTSIIAASVTITANTSIDATIIAAIFDITITITITADTSIGTVIICTSNAATTVIAAVFNISITATAPTRTNQAATTFIGTIIGTIIVTAATYGTLCARPKRATPPDPGVSPSPTSSLYLLPLALSHFNPKFKARRSVAPSNNSIEEGKSIMTDVAVLLDKLSISSLSDYLP
ncbi:hypothetical protein C7999DRAFT_29102 [Corynascus novoguineensis]|uniref:Nephrocystin 3-like N-terminal domain-containing protein n=1 Tax=Corynascus novoguineensis TaxID=1126955 RepID=A0AAN7HSW8_9PEZI|nr:hypothetical protein C7999DRAFT_29102 [Corynascus novoguineensis]